MKFIIPKKIIDVVNKIEKNGFEIYIVGGAVRDLITGRPLYDWDFTTNAKPEEIQQIFPDSFYDNQYGTVGIESEEGQRPYEITTFRTESSYSDLRRPDNISWGESLEKDLQRRDFTINAMALKITAEKPKNINTIKYDVELIDLFDGQSDLNKKLIRAVGNPSERFSEDALRMMRAIRIASELNFSIENETLAAIKEKSTSINKIAAERVRDELIKILKSPFPFEGMMLLKESGLMKNILPELFDCFGVEQKSPNRHHIYDVGMHSMMALKHCPSSNPIVRFATLMHDAGKTKTRKIKDDGTVTFYGHHIISARIAKNVAERLKFSAKDSDKFWKLIRFHMFSVDEKQTDSALRRFIKNVGQENLEDILDLRIGDRIGSGASLTSWRLEKYKLRLIEVQKQPFSVKDLKISGNDVMKILNINSGPKVGEVLQDLFDKVVEKKLENKKDVLTGEIQKLV